MINYQYLRVSEYFSHKNDIFRVKFNERLYWKRIFSVQMRISLSMILCRETGTSGRLGQTNTKGPELGKKKIMVINGSISALLELDL